ncbi:DUF2334 domain-containing protein [uncultured Clostridium sp.]|uniref:DUF2334 domain-containing protein n=1 Tax=uncultured Clostridium sp. TaxID=59620 RepID=UPI0028E19949|nr:DUF2334 domain-containing protein [uncultured Clostridium sp.]
MIYKNKGFICKTIVIFICFITINFLIEGNRINALETNNESSQAKSEIYFYLDDVTPFNDLNNLIDEVDYLRNNGIKFFIEASPVFINEDLKAMGRFAECLRYAQASGGKVILRFPIINNKGANGETINEQLINNKIKAAFDNYTNYWVYPVGMSIDEPLLYNEDLKNVLNCTDTLFLNSDDNTNFNLNSYNNKSYNNIIQKISLDDYIKNNQVNISEKSALCIESDSSFEEFKNNVDKILSKEIVLTTNDKLSSYMKFTNEVKSNSKGIYFNDKDVTQVRFINAEEYESAFNKGENKEENTVKKDLTSSNKSLEILSIVAILIFLIILLFSRKIERKRFFK